MFWLRNKKNIFLKYGMAIKFMLRPDFFIS